MPLSEFLKMLKNESGERKAMPSSSDDLSPLPENDFAELVWENGQVTMQGGQSSRAKKSSVFNNLSLQSPRMRSEPSMTSGEMDLSQDDEIAPWLNYSPNNGPQLLPQVSGLTANEPSSHNVFPFSKNVSNHNVVSSGQRNVSKLDCSPRFGRLASWSSQQGNPLGSVSSNGSINLDPMLKDSSKQDSQNLGSCPTLLNFSNFSRPVALARANLQSTEAKGKRESETKENNCSPAKTAHVEACSTSNNLRSDLNYQPNLTHTKLEPKPTLAKPRGELFPLEQTDASFKNDMIDNDTAAFKLRLSDGDKGIEAAGACSSVCSGSSAERASNDQPHGFKRKSRENDESGCRSEDADEESAGVKRAAPARGGAGAKRSRAAEVHNLSERRRRDRINEKMRALQELIPNCNKADKASMLDEAIEYLKTLQLQVQIMSMGAGMCMPQMMFPTHHMHAQMPHFPQMGLGMGMGMGFGMGLPDINGRPPGCPIFPMPQPHFSSPSIPSFPGMAAPNVPSFGLPSQGVPMSIPRTPFVPLPHQPSAGLNSSVMNKDVPSKSTVDDPSKIKNLQPTPNADPSQSAYQTTTQVQIRSDNKSDQQPIASDDPTVNMTNSTNVPGSKVGI